jgi:PKD repeat protein
VAWLTGKKNAVPTCVRALLLGSVLCLLAAAPARSAPAWLAPVTLSAPGKDAFNAGLATDAAGNSIVVWERQHETGASHDIQVATRSPGTAFSAPTDLSLTSTDPVVAMAPDGEAAIAWRHFAAGQYAIQVATRHPGGGLSPPVTVMQVPTNDQPVGIHLAINDAGAIVIAWSQLDPSSEINIHHVLGPPLFIMSSVRPAGGSFSTPKRVSPPEPSHLPAPGGEEPAQKEARYEGERNDWAERGLYATGADVAIDGAGNATVVWSYIDAEETLVQTSTSPAPGSFSPYATLSAAGFKADEARLGVDAAGDAIVVWRFREGTVKAGITNLGLQAAIRPSSGSFSIPVSLSPAGVAAEVPKLAVTPAGTATVLWRVVVGNVPVALQSVDIQLGGPPSAVEEVPLKTGDQPTFVDLATNSNGDLMLAWSATVAATNRTRGSTRKAAGAYATSADVSEPSIEAFQPDVAIDDGGSGVAVWTRSDGKNKLVEAAGYDAVPPGLTAVSIPSTGTVGTPVQFAASPVDDWPIGPARFAFGDGTAASGDGVSHAYLAPGTYQVTATAEDAARTTTSSHGTITIVARNQFTIGHLSLNRRKGTATLSVTVPEPGRLVLTGPGVKRASVSFATPGTVKLPVRATGKSGRRLVEEGRLKALLKVAYSPDGGTTNVRHKKVMLVKKPG